MRVMVFFDLPVLTKEELNQYVTFRKFLINQGFMMMQKSIYSKLVLNGVAANTAISNLRKKCPDSGIVQILVITEKQFQSIEFLIGEGQKEVVDTLDRFVVI